MTVVLLVFSNALGNVVFTNTKLQSHSTTMHEYIGSGKRGDILCTHEVCNSKSVEAAREYRIAQKFDGGKL